MEELSEDYGDEIPETFVIDEAIQEGVKDPEEKLRFLKKHLTIIYTYAARMNIQLLKASDFNEKLRERGCPKDMTIQKICKISKDENEVRKVLEAIWKNLRKARRF